MKEGIIRKKFNAASAALEKTPAGKNTLRVLGALKEVTLGFRDEGFEATLAVNHGATNLDACFEEDENADQTLANGVLTLKGEALPFVLTDDGYEDSEMYFKINWQGTDIFSMTSTWDENRKRWDDTVEDAEEDEDNSTGGWSDGYDAEGSPAKQGRRTPPLEGRIADALIGALAKIDLAQRHAVTGEEQLDKTFRVPAQIKINPPKGPL
jgi:hypothetical protein